VHLVGFYYESVCLQLYTILPIKIAGNVYDMIQVIRMFTVLLLCLSFIAELKLTHP